jgi:hypothetical protein
VKVPTTAEGNGEGSMTPAATLYWNLEMKRTQKGMYPY